MRGKKGTDKPIEIFIALFVILAVAMVILKMFSSQIEQKKKEMAEEATREALTQARAALDSFCDSKCADAYRSLKDKVTFCASYYTERIDINKNSVVDFTTDLDQIQGFCEDRIYCAAYRPCGSLDMRTCKTLMCEYKQNTLGATDDIVKADWLVGYKDETGTYDGLISPGECWSKLTGKDKKNHWFYNYMLVPDFMAPGTNCHFKYGTCLTSATLLQQKYSDIWEVSCTPETEMP